MTKKYGNLYVEDTIAKSTYSGMTADHKQATVMNILIAHENMGDQVAYNIVKAVFEHRSELIAVHKGAENVQLQLQKQAASPIPFHLGAIEYFTEKAVKLQ